MIDWFFAKPDNTLQTQLYLDTVEVQRPNQSRPNHRSSAGASSSSVDGGCVDSPIAPHRRAAAAGALGGRDDPQPVGASPGQEEEEQQEENAFLQSVEALLAADPAFFQPKHHQLADGLEDADATRGEEERREKEKEEGDEREDHHNQFSNPPYTSVVDATNNPTRAHTRRSGGPTTSVSAPSHKHPVASQAQLQVPHTHNLLR